MVRGQAITRDEQRGLRLAESGKDFDGVVEEAIDLVLQSTGADDLHSPYDGALSISTTGGLIPSP